MSRTGVWLALAAILGLLAGLLLVHLGRGMRRRRGLGGGRTVSLDGMTLTSVRMGLTGRPDRIIRQGGMIIVEEWKSARQIRPWHRVQLGVYFLLVEEKFRIRPSHGFIVCGGGKRHRIENTDELRASVLGLAVRIRAARTAITQPVPVRPEAWQCRPCGMRSRCTQARL